MFGLWLQTADYQEDWPMRKLTRPCSFVAFLIFGITAPQADEPPCQQESAAKKDNQLHAVLATASLSADQHQQLDTWFNYLMRRKRDGESRGFFCKDEEKIEDNYELEYRPQQVTSNSYAIRVRLIADKRGHNTERIRYTLGEEKLYLGTNEKSPEVLIKSLDKSELRTYEKYRQRSAGGSSIVRETIRHYRREGQALKVHNHYYLNGHLQSVNHWYFP